MPRSGYIADVRRFVGNRLLLVPSVTLCIFDGHGRLLLLRHHEGNTWSTPGGAIEPGESPAQAAAREAQEELALQVRPTAVIGVFGGPQFEIRYANGDRTTYVTTAFHCEVVAGELRPDGVEVHEATYVTEDSWRDLDVADWLDAALPDIFAWHRGGGGPARFAALVS